jgi:hypothetical protein
MYLVDAAVSIGNPIPVNVENRVESEAKTVIHNR